VIIIIGILAAIAIPVFLNQRKKAVDSSMKADLKNAATVVETYFTNKQVYPASTTFSAGVNALGSENVILSPNNAISYTVDYVTGGTTHSGAYCMVATSVTNDGTQPWVYESDQGGLQPATKTSCT
jgi:type IV pilus assembly protein PilA